MREADKQRIVDPRGQFNTGAIYYTGKHMPQDYEEAFTWSPKAAKQGNVGAQLNLAVRYAVSSAVGRIITWRGIRYRIKRRTCIEVLAAMPNKRSLTKRFQFHPVKT